MKSQTIICSDCGRSTSAKAKNQKYCQLCRCLRNLMFLGDRQTKCFLCDKKFTMVYRNDKYCPDCDTIGARGPEVLCAFCDSTTRSYLPDVGVCLHCMKSDTHRPLLIKALHQKQREVSK